MGEIFMNFSFWAFLVWFTRATPETETRRIFFDNSMSLHLQVCRLHGINVLNLVTGLEVLGGAPLVRNPENAVELVGRILTGGDFEIAACTLQSKHMF